MVTYTRYLVYIYIYTFKHAISTPPPPPPGAQVQRGLHVVFTMNPASDGFEGRCATSPALFNRCVVDWFGTWPTKALAQVTIATPQ